MNIYTMKSKKYVTIRWLKKGLELRDDICKFYGISKEITINGCSGFYATEETIERLRKSESKGVFVILTIEDEK